jgi:hypothetical protein
MSTDRRRCNELIISWSPCRPRDLVQTHRNIARIKGYVSVTENLNRSVKDLKFRKTDSGISTAERAKMFNHCKHRRRPPPSSDAILRTTPHGSMAVILKPSADNTVTSLVLLDRRFELLSRFKSRCRERIGYTRHE